MNRKTERIAELESQLRIRDEEIARLNRQVEGLEVRDDRARDILRSYRDVIWFLAERLGIHEQYPVNSYDAALDIRALKNDIDIISRAEETEGARKRLGLTKEEE